MPVIRFTELSLQNLKANTQIRFMDSTLPGFGLLVGRHRRTWFVVSGADRKLKTLGRYPAKSLKTARQEALRILDGSMTPQIPQSPIERIEEYIRGMNHTTPRYNYEQKRLLTRHLLPATCDLAKVTKSDILKITDTLNDRPSEQLHFCRAVKAFFNWMAERDYISLSPVTALQSPHSEKTRDRVLSPWELQLIWEKAYSVGSFGAVIRLCILLGTRKGETTAIEADWIRDDTLVIPASIAKNRYEHILPLTEKAKRYATKYAQMPKPNWNSWNKLRRNNLWAASIHSVSDWTIHDLRRTFATIHAQLGTPPHIIEALLNHRSGVVSGIAAIYNRYQYLPEMRTALEKYETYLEPRIFRTGD